MTIPNYVTPITKIHSTFEEAKVFFETHGGISIFDDEPKLDVVAIAQGNRNLVVGEPGVGKSLLLQVVKDHLEQNGYTVALINLRNPDSIKQIDEFLVPPLQTRKTLLLDALDEVKASLFPSFLQKIEDVSAKFPDLSIFLSCRWVFIRRYANSFPTYRFITISPFTRTQVRMYLIGSGRTESDVETLLDRTMSFSHQMLVVQIPRYLSYLDAFLKNKGLEAASKVSRNELFEYFIYMKLELEGEKLDEVKYALIKRVLEKLALSMEIYQTNVITNDELMTFFDDIKSDLKLVALSQIPLETFYDYSLLKVSHENLEKIEFENTEFQEYLAAKEISRFQDPNRAAFAFSADPDTNEIYPTWYNALTFLVDMQKNLLEQLIEFSGLRARRFKVMDGAFLTFLSRVDTRNISTPLRHQLFIDIIEYHNRTLQWLHGKLIESLPDFFDPSLESILMEVTEQAEKKPSDKRFIPLGNVLYVIAFLLRAGKPINRSYWRPKLLLCASDTNENGVLQRHALLALQFFGDPSVIDELPDLTTSEELIMEGFISMCTGLDPDHPKSLEYFFSVTRRNEIRGRYGLYAIKKSDSIKKFLHTFNNDDAFRREFLDHTTIFRDQDHVLVEKIEKKFDHEIHTLGIETLVKALHHNFMHHVERSEFITGLWKQLRKNDPSLINKTIEKIGSSSGGKSNLFFSRSFFAQVMEKEDVEPYVKAMLAVGEEFSAYNTMLQIKFSKRESAEEIYEAGRSLLTNQYKQWEDGQSKTASNNVNEYAEGILKEFQTLLEPEPGKFSTNVFQFYNQHSKELSSQLTDNDRDRIVTLLSDTVFKLMDPSQYGVTITSEKKDSKTFTVADTIHIFSDAIATAEHIGMNTTPFRQQILNFIPFTFGDSLTTIFNLVKNIQSKELAPIIEVYRKRHTDLWRLNPYSFVKAVEQYHILEAVPILKSLIFEPKWEAQAKNVALSVVDSLAPDINFLRQVVARYKNSIDNEEEKLTNVANGLLITNYADSKAVHWRLKKIVEKAAAFIKPKGPHAHMVGALENEISFGKTFAKPLMDLKHEGFEDDYLHLLDEAMSIWARGKEFQEYAVYVWEIVYAYFDNLKEKQSYMPLQKVEEKIAVMKNRDGANWLASRMVNLRRSYLTYLGKPKNISEAVTKYNEVRSYDDKKIRNSDDLFRHIQNAFDIDLKKWIEGEGAYEILGYKVAKSGYEQYEKLIQKTLKTQIENVLLKRGFQVEILRESQLLDEKRTDLIVHYGFAGPIVIEVKLTSHNDMRGLKINKSSSFTSMKRYMQGYGAAHGIFMVIDNISAKNISTIKKTFQKIKGVCVMSFNCHSSVTTKNRKGFQKKSLRKKTTFKKQTKHTGRLKK